MKTKSGPFFTKQARDAAEAARKRRRAEKEENALDVDAFVTRSGIGYGWEIRRFGGIVLDSSTRHFSSMAAARTAGAKALRERGDEGCRSHAADISSVHRHASGSPSS